MNISVVYWSGTGNTKLMAESLASGARAAGANVTLVSVADANPEAVSSSDYIALGSPAMGMDSIEEEEMEPFIGKLEKTGLTGKKIVLFGSHDWGDGQWMRDWEDRITRAGGVLVVPSVITQNVPDASVLAALASLGGKLAAGIAG